MEWEGEGEVMKEADGSVVLPNQTPVQESCPEMNGQYFYDMAG